MTKSCIVGIKFTCMLYSPGWLVLGGELPLLSIFFLSD
jgi:hypothetical protein